MTVKTVQSDVKVTMKAVYLDVTVTVKARNFFLTFCVCVCRGNLIPISLSTIVLCRIVSSVLVFKIFSNPATKVHV